MVGEVGEHPARSSEHDRLDDEREEERSGDQTEAKELAVEGEALLAGGSRRPQAGHPASNRLECRAGQLTGRGRTNAALWRTPTRA